MAAHSMRISYPSSVIPLLPISPRCSTDRPMNATLLVLNAGSSSLKFALYSAAREADGGPLCRGLLDGIGGHGHLRVYPVADAPAADVTEQGVVAGDHRQALHLVLDWLGGSE